MPRWLVDLAGLAAFVGFLIAELHVYGTKEPLVLAILAFGIAFFGIPTYGRLMTNRNLFASIYRLVNAVRFSIAAAAALTAYAWIQSDAALHPHRDVFAASAELIPVFAIAVAIEGRTSNATRDWWAGRGFLVLQTFLLFGWGEFNALAVLATGRPTRERLAWVGASLAMGFASLIVLALIGPVTTVEQRPMGRTRKAAARASTRSFDHRD